MQGAALGRWEVGGGGFLALLEGGGRQGMSQAGAAVSPLQLSEATCLMGCLLQLNYALILTAGDLTALK